MKPLSVQDFGLFMQEVTGFQPFPWQQRLVEQVVAGGGNWPELLDLPTGTGKTSVLHIAVFAMALNPKIACRRVALVVDRRIIVDQVFGVAKKLGDHLRAAKKGVSLDVANALRACSASAGADPLRVVLLRGGVPRDDAWLSTPDQPTIIASTVDQVGSRILFRGYGVSEGMRPVHAGVLGRDTLYFLDEVHLSKAFEETLGALSAYAADKWRESDKKIGTPFRVVSMSATPGADTETTFGLEEADRAHKTLRLRLDASRPAALDLVKTKIGKESGPSNREAVARVAASRAQDAVASGARTIGLVLNRVATALATAARLEKAHPKRVLLLTGRMRPLDRVRVQAEVEAVAAALPGRGEKPEHPTFVVATSCIEAGADLDFDALITEVASLPSLRQRFGRVNRLGERPTTPAWILGSKHQLGKKADADPIYGDALRATWQYLEANLTDGHVDFGLSKFPAPDAAQLRELSTQTQPPPVLFPNYLDMLSETRPAPHPDPDVALWLHGKDQDVDRDVSVISRADLGPDYAARGANESHAEIVSDALEFLPPISDESLPVPIAAFRTFAAERLGAENGAVWRWSAEGPEIVALAAVRPGDTIVVPCTWGGIAWGSWQPEARESVEDIAEQAYLARAMAGHKQSALFLRVDPRVLATELYGPSLPTPPQGAHAEDAEQWDAARTAVLEWQTVAQKDDGWVGALLRAAGNQAPKELRATLPWSDHKDKQVVGSCWRMVWQPKGAAVVASTEDSISSFSGAPVGLEQHLGEVKAWAFSFAERVHLDRALAEDVALAGWLHDIGKAEHRFQVMLHGGDEVAVDTAAPLAKSSSHSSAAARRRAQQRSGWPAGMRHELVSLALLDGSASLREAANDLELVLHLVASHHGWCRPWGPSAPDTTPAAVAVELAGQRYEANTAQINAELISEAASRFRRLCRRYGWHGLAYLEALLRLGDHAASRTPGHLPTEKNT